MAGLVAVVFLLILTASHVTEGRGRGGHTVARRQGELFTQGVGEGDAVTIGDIRDTRCVFLVGTFGCFDLLRRFRVFLLEQSVHRLLLHFLSLFRLLSSLLWSFVFVLLL